MLKIVFNINQCGNVSRGKCTDRRCYRYFRLCFYVRAIVNILLLGNDHGIFAPNITISHSPADINGKIIQFGISRVLRKTKSVLNKSIVGHNQLNYSESNMIIQGSHLKQYVYIYTYTYLSFIMTKLINGFDDRIKLIKY